MEGPAPMTTASRVQPGMGQPNTGQRLPDMTYTEQENELRAAVRSVLEEKAEAAAVLARTETPDTYDTGLWRTLAADTAVPGLLIRAARGGGCTACCAVARAA